MRAARDMTIAAAPSGVAPATETPHGQQREERCEHQDGDDGHGESELCGEREIAQYDSYLCKGLLHGNVCEWHGWGVDRNQPPGHEAYASACHGEMFSPFVT